MPHETSLKNAKITKCVIFAPKLLSLHIIYLKQAPHMGILEVVSAPPVPRSSGTAVAAHSVLKSGSNRLSAGEVRQFWRVLVETAPSEPFHWLRLGAKPRFDP